MFIMYDSSNTVNSGILTVFFFQNVKFPGNLTLENVKITSKV